MGSTQGRIRPLSLFLCLCLSLVLTSSTGSRLLALFRHTPQERQLKRIGVGFFSFLQGSIPSRFSSDARMACAQPERVSWL